MNKKIVLLLIVLIGICTISHVSAFDNSADIETQNDDGAFNDAEQPISSLDDGDDLCLDNASTTYSLDGRQDGFGDIQKTIDLAKDGDVIELNGTFSFEFGNKEIDVNKSISIVGIGDGATICFDSFNPSNSRFFNVMSSNVVLSNLKIIDGASVVGGAVVWNGDNGTVSNCEFTHNIVTGDNSYGGALAILGNNCKVTDSTFQKGQASYGGAIFVNGVNVIIENCIFNKNQANQHAGAIFLNATCGIIRNCSFTENEARGDKGHGGAVLLNANRCNVTQSNFTKNHCSDCGGAISSLGEKNTILKCEFEGNYVSDNLTDVQGGGAIYSGCEGLTIDNSTFNGNNALNAYGGAIRLAEYNTVKGSSFKDNFALLGYAIYATSNSFVTSNYFVVGLNESVNDTLFGVEDAIRKTNTFNITREDSTVTFSAGMVFEYGHSGKIYVTVEGGIIELKNIEVLGHPEAVIQLHGNFLTVSGLAVGKYTLRVVTTPDENHYATSNDLSITVNQATATIKASKVTVALKKGTAWQITIADSKSGKGIGNMELTLKVYTGKKYKTVHIKTNSKGVASFKTSGLAKGNHKVVVSGKHPGYTFDPVTSYIKVVKPKKLTFEVSKKTYKEASTVMFRVFLKGKAVNGIKLNLHVYNGKKVVKTIKLKSRNYHKKKGFVGYTTNELSVGKHKVVIKPANVKYGGSKKSSIKISKKQKKHADYSSVLSA